jgi:hypothetical protein
MTVLTMRRINAQQRQLIEAIIRDMTIVRDNNGGLVDQQLNKQFRNALKQAGCSEEQVTQIKRTLGLLKADQGRLHQQRRQQRAKRAVCSQY